MYMHFPILLTLQTLEEQARLPEYDPASTPKMREIQVRNGCMHVQLVNTEYTEYTHSNCNNLLTHLHRRVPLTCRRVLTTASLQRRILA